jgi:hypothetical protein
MRTADCGLEPFSRRACPARRSAQFSRDPQGSALDCGLRIRDCETGIRGVKSDD